MKKTSGKTVPLFAIISLLCLSAFSQSKALQKNYSLADTASVADDGLLMGYNIKSLSQKEVGDKGEFSRYSLQFYITNISAEAKIFLYNQGWQVANDVSPYIAKFDCLNATGARLTSKSAQLQLAACNVLALVEDRDRDNKSVKNKRFVQIGYWIKPGETVKADAIMIVPLNEKLNMNVTLYPNMNADIVSNASVMGQPPFVSAAPAAGFDPNNAGANFYKIRNASKNTYLNNQNGPVDCTTINNEWWSAQWKFVPVVGGYFLIKNKWKGSFISTENGTMISDNYNINAAWWIIERSANSNSIRFRNVANGTYLNIEHGRLESGTVSINAESTGWIVEM